MESLNCGGNIRRVAFHRRGSGDLEVALVHRALHAGEPSLAIGIVLIEDGDVLQPDRVQLLDDFFGFVEVAGADVEDMAVERVAQQLCAGERPDEGNACLGEDRQGGLAGRRAHIAKQCEDAFFIDQFLRVCSCTIRFIAVVQRAKLDLATVDASLGIDAAKIGERTLPHFAAEFLGRTAEGGRLADQNGSIRDPLVGT